MRCKWCDGYKSDSNVVWICPKANITAHSDGYVLCGVDCERARPNTFCKLSEKAAEIPESCLVSSKKFILPDLTNQNKQHITMDNALNGYMFGLSYHILNEDTISVYWYRGAGGVVFDLKDIQQERGWSIWFDKINGLRQELNAKIVNEINRLRNKDDRIQNIDFDEFEKQCNSL